MSRYGGSQAGLRAWLGAVITAGFGILFGLGRIGIGVAVSVGLSLAGSMALSAGTAALLSGCGGSETTPEKPVAPVENPTEPEDVLIPPEELEAVSLYFERKRTAMSRCFSEAIEAGEIPGNARQAFLSVTVTIVPGGNARDISFTEVAAKSSILESCARGRIESWSLPEVSQPIEYSHRYGFSAL